MQYAVSVGFSIIGVLYFKLQTEIWPWNFYERFEG